jgi:hypothetical protein
MKINLELIIGILITGLSAYYWIDISDAALSGLPIFFRFTYRLFPYFDWVITGAGLWMLYTGIKKLRK